jgi:RNA-splicing ligase RtcB
MDFISDKYTGVGAAVVREGVISPNDTIIINNCVKITHTPQTNLTHIEHNGLMYKINGNIDSNDTIAEIVECADRLLSLRRRIE